MKSANEIMAILASGDFSSLIDESESEVLDAKVQPYWQLGQATESWKFELAKDVSSFANARGGLLLIGFATKKLSDSRNEQIAAVRPFAQADLDIQQYRGVIKEWIEPSIPELDIRWFAQFGSDRGVVAISVPPIGSRGPCLVNRIPDADGKIMGNVVGLFERRGADSTPLTAAQLQSAIRVGRELESVESRLRSIEEQMGRLLDQMAGSPPKPPTKLTEQELLGRRQLAKIAAERDGRPTIVLSAAAEPASEFPNLFRSATEPIVKAFTEPTPIRQDGFAITEGRSSILVGGKLRRSDPPTDQLRELWKDGFFVALGPGDQELLCWGQPRLPGGTGGLRIRNFVLTEIVMEFVRQALDVFAFAEPSPEKLTFYVGLEDMTEEGQPCQLSIQPDRNGVESRPRASRTAPTTTIHAGHITPFAKSDYGQITFSLIEGIYHKFGFESMRIPFIDEVGSRIDSMTLLDKPDR